MAHLVRPTVVSHVLNGRRVKAGTPGAKKVKKKSGKWYGAGIPGHPPKKRFPLARDKEAAKRMLADLVAGVERGQAGIPDAGAGRRPLADHLTAFTAAVAHGLASRAKGGRRVKPDPKQVHITTQRVRDALGGCGFRSVADLNAAAPGKLAAYLHHRTTLPRKAGGLSQQSAQFHLAAARRFVWWLAEKGNAPVKAGLFDDIPGFDPANNRVHARREIAPAELAALLATTRTGGVEYRGLAGEDRYFVYLTAFATGWRAGELAKVQPEFFALDAEPPVLNLPGRMNKNKKVSRQPLPPGVAHQLRAYLTGKPRGRRLWPGTWNEKPVKMLRFDLTAAGVPYEVATPDGPKFADFHALRHTFLSALAAAGVGVKELQELARHSDPRLTLGVYTHARPEALAASVARLPVPGEGGGSPFAAMSRAELESALAGMLGVVAVLFAPRLAPGTDSAGDNPGRAGRINRECRGNGGEISP